MRIGRLGAMLTKLKNLLLYFLGKEISVSIDNTQDAPEQGDAINNNVPNIPATTVPAVPTQEVQDTVKESESDFKSAFEFVYKGIALLGESAKDELVALVEKHKK